MAEDSLVAAAEVPVTIRYVPEVDGLAGILMGLQACLGTLWWILIMFVYVKNASTDADLKTIAGTTAIPLTWWWERAGEYGGTKVFLGVSLILSFFFYAIVSVVELVAWVMYMFDTMEFARFYFRTVGYWGSLIFYSMPALFAFVQVITQDTLIWPGTWALY